MASNEGEQPPRRFLTRSEILELGRQAQAEQVAAGLAPKQEATVKYYRVAPDQVQRAAEEQVIRVRRTQQEAQRQEAVRLAGIKLAEEGIDTNVGAPYTPRLVAADANYGAGLATIAVPLRSCTICDRWMVGRDTTISIIGFENELGRQLQRAGFVFDSGAYDKQGHRICAECKTAGKSTFVCDICKQERTSDQIKRSFGYDPPDEYLCVPCFETVTASEWQTKVESLEERHRYDGD